MAAWAAAAATPERKRASFAGVVSERILIIEDDDELGAELVRQLERASYSVSWIRDGDRALQASLDGVDLVLLDLVLPGT